MAKKGGQSKYNRTVKPYLNLIRQWKSDGYSDLKIMTTLNIPPSTWQRYKNEKPSLKTALDEPADVLGMELEKRAYQKVMLSDSTKNNDILKKMLTMRNDRYNKDKVSGSGGSKKLEISFTDAKQTDEQLGGYVKDIEEKLKQGKV